MIASRPLRLRVLVLVAVVVLAAAFWGSWRLQRSADDRAFTAQAAAEGTLTAMLDQETGVRGFGLTGRDAFLAPYRDGRRAFERTLTDLQVSAGASRAVIDAIRRDAVAARAWQALAEEDIVQLRTHGRGGQTDNALSRKRLMDRFRAANAALRRVLERRRAEASRRTEDITLAVLAGLVAGFGALLWGLVLRGAEQDERRRRRERAYDATQSEFNRALQVMAGEEEAHRLLVTHLERTLPDARAVVLNRNNSADRLQATTPVQEGTPLHERLPDARPSSCLAVRMARAHERDAGDLPLVACELCGAQPGRTACEPLLVGGEVIGSVLVEHHAPLAPDDRRRIEESVAHAAPVLANLRNLAVAEHRAATDALTGLPNRRAMDDTLKRMLAYAGRTLTPLSAILFDLDRFKQVNDVYGHEAGDEVLAAVGDAVASAVRASDFVARCGGEEFAVLLPDTAAAAALDVAGKLRQALRGVTVPGLERPVTASFGVASYPVDAVDGAELLRAADRGLYRAKERGRDRVEHAVGPEALTEPT